MNNPSIDESRCGRREGASLPELQTRNAVVLLLIWLMASCALSADELERRATWQLADETIVADRVAEWLKTQELEEEVVKSSLEAWDSSAGSVDQLQRAIACFVAADRDVAQVIGQLQAPASIGDLPDFAILGDEEVSPFVRDNLRLYIGKWLAISGMYNECIETLEPLEVAEVIAPESLLFYRGVAQYRLRNKEEGLESIERLLENKDELPRRYVALAELMQAELDALKPDSLDEIARIMDSVRVRLGLGRAGTRVRKEEDEVIEKLDKLIEDLEEKRKKQQQQQSSGNAKGNRSQNPAEDSSLPGGQASPEVDPKRLASETEWGDLPPKEREEALQSLGKEFPSHYREVIEEYFRKIARDEVETP